MFVERCLNSYTSQNVLIKHKQQCGEQDITSLRTSNESHLYWKKIFHKKPMYFKIYADFEADNEIDKTNIGTKQLIFINKTQCLTDIV